ncbi:hypothetical protein ALC62_05636 [Cyphomyrmex costatus]|uniref:Uncharacterized protein n=1 Tax=Cyphomyrmex costatus TaxID=456900 RepID=A0A195CTQ0_9HYME|nr:hypothetical protein ALC62_05636 [Cyphomyrmex costatus]
MESAEMVVKVDKEGGGSEDEAREGRAGGSGKRSVTECAEHARPPPFYPHPRPPLCRLPPGPAFLFLSTRSRGLREGIGDAQSRVSFPSPAPSPEGTISSGTESAREPGRGDPPDLAAIPIASLFDMRQFRPICHAP